MTEKKHTICLCASGDLWAGAEVQVYNLARALQTSGSFRVIVILLNDGVLADRLREHSIPLHVLDEQHRSFFELRKALQDVLKQEHVRVLHTHRYKENILGALVRTEHGNMHRVQTVHGNPEGVSAFASQKMKLYQLINRLCTRIRFDTIIAVSHELREQLAAYYHSRSLITIHNGIHIPETPTEHARDHARQSFGLAPSDEVCLAIGRFVPVKAFDVLLKAFARLRLVNEHARLLLVGDGPEDGRLRALVESLDLQNSVIMPGHLPDIERAYLAADLLVMSSQHEGIPMTVLEALAYQLPTLATRVGGIPEIIEHEKTGVLCEPNDESALAEAMSRLLADPAKRHEIGHSGREHVATSFSIAQCAEGHEKLYTKLISSTQV